MFDTRLTIDQERWLGQLYETHSPAVLRLCWRMLSNSQDSADACQEVFLRAANSLASDAPQAEARAWLFSVARNYCIDQLRRQKRLNTALTRIGADSQPEVDPESSVVDRDTVDAIFKQLSARERTVLWQTAVEHRPLAEIANRLHLNYMAAGQVVSRARKHASMLAAKVAAIFLIFRLISRRVGSARLPSSSGGTGWGLVAVVLPLVALSVQPSSSATASAAPAEQPAPAANRGPATSAGGASSKANALPLPASSALPLAPPTPSVSVPALPIPSGSASNTINQIIGTLPSPLPFPTPVLPTPQVIR